MKVTQADIVAAEAQAKKHYQTLYDYEMDLRQSYAAHAAQARQEVLDGLRDLLGRRGPSVVDRMGEEIAIRPLDYGTWQPLADALQEQKP